MSETITNALHSSSDLSAPLVIPAAADPSTIRIWIHYNHSRSFPVILTSTIHTSIHKIKERIQSQSTDYTVELLSKVDIDRLELVHYFGIYVGEYDSALGYSGSNEYDDIKSDGSMQQREDYPPALVSGARNPKGELCYPISSLALHRNADPYEQMHIINGAHFYVRILTDEEYHSGKTKFSDPDSQHIQTGTTTTTSSRMTTRKESCPEILFGIVCCPCLLLFDCADKPCMKQTCECLCCWIKVLDSIMKQLAVF